MTVDKSIYYNPNIMFSHDKIINFTTGRRGLGKTYGIKKWLINRFLKTGRQFIYVRRWKTELTKVKFFFGAVQNEFPDTKFQVKGREFYIDGKLAGFAIPLSSWQSEKSNEYADVDYIFFDEFIREKDTNRANGGYIPNEVQSFVNFMHTVFRERQNVKVVCCSNATTITNPYFVYFGLTPDVSKEFYKKGHILVHLPPSDEFNAATKGNWITQLTEGTDYHRMATSNEFIYDSDAFLHKLTPKAKFKYVMVVEGKKYGIWIDPDRAMMFFSQKYDPSCKTIICLDREDYKEDYILINSYKDHYFTKKYCSAFKKGMLFFDGQLSRNEGYKALKNMKYQ